MIYIIQGNGKWHYDRDGELDWVVGYFLTKEDAQKYCNKLNQFAERWTTGKSDCGITANDSIAGIVEFDKVLSNKVYDVQDIKEFYNINYRITEVNRV